MIYSRNSCFTKTLIAMGATFSKVICCKCCRKCFKENKKNENEYEEPEPNQTTMGTSETPRNPEENQPVPLSEARPRLTGCENENFEPEQIYADMAGISVLQESSFANPQIPEYHGQIERNEAERRLLGPDKLNYSFLIRENKDNTAKYVLSVRINSNNNGMQHQKIMKDSKGYYGLDRSTKSFTSLRELVRFYQNNGTDWIIRLSTPCLKGENQSVTEPGTSDKWEIDRTFLGSFHHQRCFMRFTDYKAKWSFTFDVAVRKTMQGLRMYKDEFIFEVSKMKTIQHANVIQVYGFCTLQRPYFIVTEYMPYGDLKTYLTSDKGSSLRSKDLLYMGAQVACGMSHLAKHNHVYGKLAARNIAVGDDNICKIADVGLNKLSRESQPDTTAPGQFPDKWKAPEAYRKNRFTSQSDVWSFGILLMEIITKGDEPYLGYNDVGLLQEKIKNGHRMDRPESCPAALYDIMLQCWDLVPQARPSFDDVYKELKNLYTEPETSWLLPPNPPSFTEELQQRIGADEQHFPPLPPSLNEED
ncbi:tyrosine-protein kinase SRK2-like isoform X2 [Clavelina lepadiformis]|uniref:tyrosine-protein kinase SRK2-like isoform X2 n=1 Tax=Clavelina lepadiformis TaxID=159417 RepID=UPI00404177B1